MCIVSEVESIIKIRNTLRELSEKDDVPDFQLRVPAIWSSIGKQLEEFLISDGLDTCSSYGIAGFFSPSP